MKKMDVATELKFCREFAHGLDCSIDNLLWRMKSDLTKGMTCVSCVPEAAKEFCNHPSGPLAGKPMSCTVNQKPLALFVERGFFAGVRASGEGIAIPETEARLFEFKQRNLNPVSNKFRIVVFVEGLQAPLFQEYFGKPDDGGEKFCISVDFPPSHSVGNGLEFNFHDCRYLVCTRSEATRPDRHQLIVEALDKIDYNVFCSAVRRILYVIGFFTGSYGFGPFWVFDAATHEFLAYNECMGKACHARYTMFSTNPWNYYAEEDKKLLDIKNFPIHLTPIAKKHFEFLLKLLDDAKFSEMFYVFQDLSMSSRAMTVATRFVAYAVCLEMCAAWLADKIKREKSENIQSMFTQEERNTITAELELFLGERIKDLEKFKNAMNKVRGLFDRPNKDKLCNAFERGGVTLMEEDRKTIDTRNKLLHGGKIIEMPSDTGNPLPYVEDAEEKSFRFHSLIWRFIMTSIGYDGQYIDCQKLGKMFRASQSNDGRPLIRDVKTGKEL